MRWVFYSLVIVNLAYLGWHLAGTVLLSGEPTRTAEVEPGGDLVLLAEHMDPDDIPDDTPDTPTREGLCPFVGPWESDDAAAEALQALEQDYRGQVRALEVERDRLKWVHVPPAESEEEALRMLRELQSRGVDSFLVSEGDDANAISLGYFASPDSARGLKLKMRDEGYPVEIRETAREVTEYWVLIERDSLDDEGQALRAFLAESGRELEHADCKDGHSVR